MQLCDTSVSNPLVTPIHNETTCVNMVIFGRLGECAFFRDIVEVKQFLDTNLTIGIHAS